MVGRVVDTRSGARLIFEDATVTKWHRPGTDPASLARRLAAIADAPFVQPLGPPAVDKDGRVSTRWPLVEVASPASPPWRKAGALLAALHRQPVPTAAGRHGWPERLSRATQRAKDPALARLGRRLQVEVANRPEQRTLIHGDWHLGQLGRISDGWMLLDPDDVGAGDPAWDLARPAGFWAAGLLPDAHWDAFLDGYGRRPDWAELDLAARTAVFVAATQRGLHSRGTATALLSACRRMAQWEP